MEKVVQLGQVRPSPPRVGVKVEALSPEDNLFYFAVVDALLPSEELGEGQLRLSFCGVGLNGEKSSLVVKARDVRRQGGKIVRGRPTAHAAPPVSGAQASGSTIKAAPVALRLPPMGAGGLPSKGRGSAIALPPGGRPSPNPSPVAPVHLPPSSNRPPSHGDIRPEASVPKPLPKPLPSPNSRPPSLPGDPVSIEPSPPSRVAVNPNTAPQPPSFGQASPHHNTSSPQPPPKHRERPPALQASPGAPATRTLPPAPGIHSPPQSGASTDHLHRAPPFDPDASGVEPPAPQAGRNTTGGFVRAMSHELNQVMQAPHGRGSPPGVARSSSHDLQRKSPYQRPLPVPHGARPEDPSNAPRSGGHYAPPPLGGSEIISARSGLRPTPPKPTRPV